MSPFLNLNWNDFLKGLIVAVITAVLTFAYEALQSGSLFAPGTLKTVGLIALTAMVSYLLKNLFTNSHGEILKNEKSQTVLKAKNKGKIAKALLLIVLLLGIGMSVNAQSLIQKIPSDLFIIKTISAPLMNTTSNQPPPAIETVSDVKGKWLPRLNAGIMGVSWELKKGTSPVPFEAIGFGIGYLYYKNVNGEPFNVWGVNALFITDTKHAALGAGLYGTYNTNQIGLVNLGLHWDAAVNKFFVDTGLTYNF